jgi:hypothetical protein
MKSNCKKFAIFLPIALIGASCAVIGTSFITNTSKKSTADVEVLSSSPKETTYSLKLDLIADYKDSLGDEHHVEFVTKHQDRDSRIVFTVRDGEVVFADNTNDQSLN